MENNDKTRKELLFLEPYNSHETEEETVKKLAKILESFGFKIEEKEQK